MDSAEAYNYAAGVYTRYQSARAEGKSSGEALGAVGGTLGGAAACAATGAGVAVAGLCGTVGGILGGIVGGALADLFSSPDNHTNEICKAVGTRLDELTAAAQAAGLNVTREQAQLWFVDAAWRDRLAHKPGWAVVGEVGTPGAYIRTPEFDVPLDARGRALGAIPDGRPLDQQAKESEGWFTRAMTALEGATDTERQRKSAARQQIHDQFYHTLLWNPTLSGGCAGSARMTIPGVPRDAAVGLVAVGARIEALTQAKRAAAWTWAAVVSLAAGALWWRHNRTKTTRR